AVVGLSDDRFRPVYGVSRYLKSQGFRIIPVNPLVESALGEPAYPNLKSVPEPIDFADVFRRPEFIPEVVEDAIAAGVPAIWLQDGIIHVAAARRAEEAGLDVIMDT
ncbi:MAG TPA: CoA-binding protein, partial [Dehalococcoidia bacterium]|nr:CoA-binding protein [Dehalococcoidia bacterium]